MSDLKTRPTASSVAAFLDGVADEQRRGDCQAVLQMMRDVTGAEPRMWGTSIVGFGSYHYTYESGREGDWFVTGFSPRKGDLTLYINGGLEQHAGLLEQLGRHRTGRACLYIRRLADVDRQVLRELVARSVAQMSRLVND